jgi:hypothetical protein
MIMVVHTRDMGKERADPSPHARRAHSPDHHSIISKPVSI